MTKFSDSVFARLLGRLADTVCRFPASFVWPQIILFLLGLLYAAYELKLDMNRDHLVSPKSRYQRISLNIRREFPAPDELVVVVESGNPERNRQFVERLATRLAGETNLLGEVFYKADLATLGRKALLLAPENDLEQIRKTLRENRPFLEQLGGVTNLNSLFEFVNSQFLNAGSGTNAGGNFLVQSLPALQRVVDQATHSALTPGSPPSPGVASLFGLGSDGGLETYVTFDHGRMFLLTARARTEDQNPAAIRRLRELIAQTQSEVPGLNAGLTGGPVLDYDEMRQSSHDSILASLVSLVLCSGIFIVAYRQWGRPMKAAFCLIVGLGCTLGYAAVAVGHLNILTITFAPMLIGLAIDFAIHFISRYEEEIRHRRSPAEAVRNTTALTGQGIVTGALTTAVAFLAMALSSFKGVQEMGLISGGGLLICLVPMMTMLPALLMRGRATYCRPQPADRGASNPPDDQSQWASGRRRLEHLWLNHPFTTVAITLALCALAATQFQNVFFDYNLLQLQSRGTPSVIYERKLIRSASQSAVFATVLANDEQQAREFTERIRKLPSVAGVQSATDYLNGNQRRRLELVRAVKQEVAGLRFAPIDTGPIQLDDLGATLWSTTGYLGLAAEAARAKDPGLAGKLEALRDSIIHLRGVAASGQPRVARQLGRFQQSFLADIHSTFDTIRTQDASGPMRPRDLPPVLRNTFIGVTGKLLLQVYSKNDLWQHDNQRELLDELYSVVPEEQVGGTPLGLYQYTTVLKNSYEQAAWYALAAIVVMLAWHFRSPGSVILALLPVAIGTTWLLGFMGAVGIPFNPANIMTLPLVIGIGVTNGIQVLNRLAEERIPGLFGKSTGKAVLVSGLTAIVGFGSLTLGRHQGIRSLGLVMAVGIAACMIAALTFLPALLSLLMRRGWELRLGAPARTAPTGAA